MPREGNGSGFTALVRQTVATSSYDPSNPMRVVDLFVDHLVPFEELWSRSDRFDLSQTTVRVASIPDLIQLKRLAGRPQELADIDQLNAILRAKKR